MATTEREDIEQIEPQIPVETKFSILGGICRAHHFAWREAVAKLFPAADPGGVVRKMWEVTARQSAQAYLKRLDPTRPLAPQVAASITWSRVCMGDRATFQADRDRDQAFVRHDVCPWYDWHKRLGLLEEDRPACDQWFLSTVAEVNSELGSALGVETLKSLPDGDDCCLRRLWAR